MVAVSLFPFPPPLPMSCNRQLADFSRFCQFYSLESIFCSRWLVALQQLLPQCCPLYATMRADYLSPILSVFISIAASVLQQMGS